MTQERREHPRVFATSDVTLSIGGKAYGGMLCRNFSMGGMYVQIDTNRDTDELHVSDEGTVSMVQQCGQESIPFSASFRFVRHVAETPHGWGLEFTDISAPDRDNLSVIVGYELALRR